MLGSPDKKLWTIILDYEMVFIIFIYLLKRLVILKLIVSLICNFLKLLLNDFNFHTRQHLLQVHCQLL